MTTISAAAFRDAFLRAYSEGRKQYDDQGWKMMWQAPPDQHPCWNHFMLDAPERVDKSVIGKVAEYLGLKRCLREPFRLDAILHRGTNEWDWYPMMVAIEHENDPRGFTDEVRKLASVRSPLKVGITYASLPSDDEKTALRNRYGSSVLNIIRRECNNTAIAESDATEYLFLLGEIAPNLGIEWRSLTFHPDENLGALEFR